MSLQSCLEEYLAYNSVERGLIQTTINNYGTNCRRFVAYLKSTGNPEPAVDDFCPETMKAFLYKRSEASLKPGSTRLQIVVLKGFGKWLVDKGYLEENPMRNVIVPKVVSPKQDIVYDEEAQAMLSACDRIHDKRRSALARAIVSMFIYSGLRRTELLNLKMDDVSFNDQSVTVVHGKGRKTRIVYPHPECFADLRNWLTMRPKCVHEYVFALDRSRRMFNEALTTLFREVKAIAELSGNDRVHPHAFRRGCGTRLMSQGYSMFDVQTFLGHSDQKTTQIYLASNQRRLKQLAGLGDLRPTPTQAVEAPAPPEPPSPAAITAHPTRQRHEPVSPVPPQSPQPVQPPSESEGHKLLRLTSGSGRKHGSRATSAGRKQTSQSGANELVSLLVRVATAILPQAPQVPSRRNGKARSRG
jgi:site-specific recombinase XerD